MAASRTMSRWVLPGLCTACFVYLGGLPAPAATGAAEPGGSAPARRASPWSVSFDLTFATKDFGRPLRVFGPVLQHDLDIGYRIGTLGTIGIDSWGDMDLTNTSGHAGRYVEWDTSAYWRRDVDRLGSLELGYTRFNYPTDAARPWTHEVYAKMKANSFLETSLAAHRDVGAFGGWYLRGDVAHRVALDDVLGPIARGASFELRGTVSWGDARTIRRFFLESDHRSEPSIIGGYETAALHIPLARSGHVSVTLSPFGTLLERVASTAHPRTSWVVGVGLNVVPGRAR